MKEYQGKGPEIFRFFLDGAIALLGGFLCALSVNAILLRMGLLSGGLTGVAMVFNHLWNLPTSLLVFVLNLPLLALGYLKMGRAFFFKTIVGIVGFSFFLQVTNPVDFSLTDPILGALLSGGMSGAGIGIVYRRDASLGGTDILSVYLNRTFGFPLGSVNAAVNIAILLAAGFLYGLQTVLYSLICIVAMGVTTDWVVDGVQKSRTLLIISEQGEEIGRQIGEGLRRGTTLLPARGGYTGEKKAVLYCVVSRLELSKAKRIILNVDPSAFFTIADAKEVLGRGFSRPKEG